MVIACYFTEKLMILCLQVNMKNINRRYNNKIKYVNPYLYKNLPIRLITKDKLWCMILSVFVKNRLVDKLLLLLDFVNPIMYKHITININNSMVLTVYNSS